MTREDIDIMWNKALQQAIKDGEEFTRYHFAALVAAAERERIIAANAPEIERVNAHIKALENAVAAEREACAQIVDENASRCGTAIRLILESNAAAIRARGQA